MALMFCAPEASRLLLRRHMKHGKPGLKHRNNDHRWIRTEISHDLWDRYWLFVVQNDAMANAIAYRNLMFPELCCQISDDIKFVNQQSSGSRSINISWIRKIVIYVVFSFFCGSTKIVNLNMPKFYGSTKFGEPWWQKNVDPQKFELDYAKKMWIHKISWTLMTKKCGSTKIWTWLCQKNVDPQNFVHPYVILLWINKNQNWRFRLFWRSKW